MNRNRSHQPSRLKKLNDTINEVVEKTTFQEQFRLNKVATEMISKRLFYLKQTVKVIKAQHEISTVDMQDLKGMKEEVKFLEVV